MYQFNAANLKENVTKAYSTGGKFINKAGEYRAMIECAFWEQNDYGYKSLILQIINDSEQSATLKLTYENEKGERAYGANHIDAMIVCAGLRKGLSAAPDTAMIYSWQDKSVVETDVSGCPELKGKWFTFLLQEKKDAYVAKNGDKAGQWVTRDEVTISSIYQDNTKLSAVEIIDKKTVSADFEKHLANLLENPVYETNGFKQYNSGAKNTAQAGGTGYANQGKQTVSTQTLDDDLPF